MRRNIYLRALAVGAAAALVLGACGGDDDDDAAADTDETTAEADETAFCDAYHETNTQVAAFDNDDEADDDPAALTAALDDVEEAAPSDISDAIATMVATGRDNLEAAQEPQPEGEEEGPPDIPSDEYFEASQEVGTWVADNCDFGTLDVTAKNYEFSGIEDIDSGTVLVDLTNEGTEFHEVLFMRIADGETRPLEELLQLPEEEVGKVATQVGGVTFAPPASGNAATYDFEPGRHVAICFIPVGATPEALQSGQLDENAEPHFAHGMVTEFQVS